MRFEFTELAPACLIYRDRHEDERGAFGRIHCEREFDTAGLPSRVVQSSLSSTRRRGTVRGMHFQKAPSREGKIVRCLQGRIFDVIIDLRPGSSGFCSSFDIELAGDEDFALFVPPGFAHGFQAQEDDTLILYQMTDFYEPELSCGVRWDDPAFAIRWPLPIATIDERDARYPDFDSTLVSGFEGY